jgi:hypothetical protein
MGLHLGRLQPCLNILTRVGGIDSEKTYAYHDTDINTTIKSFEVQAYEVANTF